jgi:hypothetical protein
MRRFLITLLLTGAIVLQLPVGYAQRKTAKPVKATPATITAQRGTDVITSSQLKDYLSFIASDELEGRDTPSRGLDTAAKFLAMNLSRWGLKPAGDDGTYFQKIALRRDRIDATQTSVELNGRTLTLGEEYIPSANAGKIPRGPIEIALSCLQATARCCFTVCCISLATICLSNRSNSSASGTAAPPAIPSVV